MRSNLLNSITILSFIFVIGCSTAPVDLPLDYGSAHSKHIINDALFTKDDLEKTCDQVYDENEKLKDILHKIKNDNKNDRVSDQAIVYLFGAVTMLFDINSDIEEQRNKVQKRQDNLSLLRRYKKC